MMDDKQLANERLRNLLIKCGKQEKRISELEAENQDLRDSKADMLANHIHAKAELQRKYDALVEGLKPHIADLERTADKIEAWQDPNVGPFDGTIAEFRKAAHELRALLEDDDG